MAAVLESVTIPRASAFQSTRSPPSMVSSFSALSSSAKIRSLPEFRGLKIQFSSQKLVSSRIQKRIVPRNGRIVSEAQDTALEVPSVTEKTWQSQVLESSLPVLVEFWAPWCGPCHMIHPVIGELAKQYAGKLDCYKLNTDLSPVIATKYGIRSIPTVMIFKNGEKKDAIIGAVPKTTLTTCIEKLL